jgi:two-component system chemotaxis sensor kinase CheA
MFAVPQSSVREVAEVDPGAIRALENNELITHRGEALPVIRLGRIFAIPGATRTRLHMLVVGNGTAPIGVLVDRISGQRESVVKTIADPLIKVAGVSGATELGDGRLVLILDPTMLTRLARTRATAK